MLAASDASSLARQRDLLLLVRAAMWADEATIKKITKG
jgi:hypothetical protein